MEKCLKNIEQILEQKSFDDVIKTACEAIKDLIRAEAVGFYKSDVKKQSYTKIKEIKNAEIELPKSLNQEDLPGTYNFLAGLKEKQASEKPYLAEDESEIFEFITEVKERKIVEVEISDSLEKKRTLFQKLINFAFPDRSPPSIIYNRITVIPLKRNDFPRYLHGVFVLQNKGATQITKENITVIMSLCRILGKHFLDLEDSKFHLTMHQADILKITHVTSGPQKFKKFYDDIFVFLKRIDPTIRFGEIWIRPLEKEIYDKMVLRGIDNETFLPSYNGKHKLNISDYAIGEAIINKEPKYYEKVGNIRNFHIPEIKKEFFNSQLLALPFHIKVGSAVGVLLLYFPEDNPTIQRNKALFQFYANLIGHAINNKLYAEKIRVETEIFKVIGEYMLQDPLIIFQEKTDFFPYLCKKLVEILEVGGFSVFFSEDSNSNIISMFATSGITIPEDWKGIPKIDITKGGLTSRVIKEDKIIIEDDLEKAKRTGLYLAQFPEKLSDREIWLGVPIKSGENIKGVIRLLNRQRDIPNMSHFFDFNDDDMSRLIGSFFWLIKQQLQNLQKAHISKHLAIHDMRNTLQASFFAAQMLSEKIPKSGDKDLDRKLDYLLKNLEGSIELLAFLTRVPDVLDTWSPYFKKINFEGQIIAPVVGLIRWYARHCWVEIEYNNLSRIPLFYLDESRMKQLVYNLLINGIKYSKDCPKKQIKINYKGTVEGFHLIDFEDSGIGIDKSEIEKIFEYGYRGEQARKLSFEGDGVGSTYAQKIAQKHGGIIEVTNLKDPTIFTLKLPISLEEDPIK